jgi:hypothetical protein
MADPDITESSERGPDFPPLRCARCDGEMERGFVIDRDHWYAGKEAHWARGTPAKGFFGLLKDPPRQKQIVTYRCTRCGRLESFAP